MKKMLGKKVRSMLALLLSAAMIIGMVPAMAFAEESGGQSKEVNLLVFGNSTSSGYGMPDFYNENNGYATLNNYLEDWACEADGFNFEDWGRENFGKTSADWAKGETAWTLKAADNWWNERDGEGRRVNKILGRMSVAAFPWQLKKYIAQEEGAKVNLNPICFNGMRNDELRAFLDEDYYREASAREYRYAEKYMTEVLGLTRTDEPSDDGYYWFTGTDKDGKPVRRKRSDFEGFLNFHFGLYIGGMYDSRAIPENTYAKAHEFVKSSVENADVIVLDVTGNSFGTYLGYRLNSSLGRDDRCTANLYETVDDLDIPDDIKNGIMKLDNMLKSSSDVFKSGIGEQLLEAYIYSLADCIVNYKANMDMINRYKKDGAKVISVGVNNPMTGLILDTGDLKVDFGKVSGAIYEIVNTYIKAIDKNADNYYNADVPYKLTSFAGCVADAESFDKVINGGDSFEDGLQLYSISMIYECFLNDFMGGPGGDARTVYELVQNGIKENAKNDQYHLVFDKWDSLGNDDPMTFSPESYMTVDNGKLDTATTQEEIAQAFDASADKPAKESYVTKETMKKVAAMIIMGDLSNDQKAALQQQAIESGCTTEEAIREFIYDYCYAQADDNAIAQAYAAIQDGYRQVASGAANFSDLSDDECATFNPLGGNLYITVDLEKQAEGFDKMFGYSTESSDKNLTKNILRQVTDASVKPAIEKMLYESVHDHGTIYPAKLQEALSDMSKVEDDISSYLAAIIMGQSAKLDEAYWGLLNLEVRFLLSYAVGEHPNAVGCEEKYQAVKEAYLSDKTAKDISREEAKAKLDELLAELQEISEKIKALVGEDAYQRAMDELNTIMEQLKELGLAVSMLPEYEKAIDEYKQLVEELGNESAELKDEVVTLKYEIAQLEAEAIAVDLKPVVSFPAGKVQVSVSWTSDDRAAGYEFKVDGAEKSPAVSGTNMSYAHKGLAVGKAHTYEVTPYIVEEIDGVEETFYGRAVKKTVTPKVSLNKAAIKKVKGGKKSLKVKWGKVAGASGYEVSCKTGKKTVKKIVKGAGKVSVKIGKLKKGKKYTVKVRAWKTVNGKKYYGKWSSAKKAKVKK